MVLERAKTSEVLGKTLQKAFSLARYVDGYREKPFTTEAKAFQGNR
jgi:hypothetical protein